MKLSPIIRSYFDDWIGRESWHTCHPLDNERFNCFIKAVARYSRSRAPSPADIHAIIVQRWRGQELDLDDTELDERANEFAERYQMLLNYEKTKCFPNPLIEGTNILKYYLALSPECREDAQRTNRIMTKALGEDWQTKYARAMEDR